MICPLSRTPSWTSTNASPCLVSRNAPLNPPGNPEVESRASVVVRSCKIVFGPIAELTARNYLALAEPGKRSKRLAVAMPAEQHGEGNHGVAVLEVVAGIRIAVACVRR